MSEDAELAALATIVAALQPLDFDARDRVLDYARKKSSDFRLVKSLCELAEMWQKLTEAVSKTINGCQTCNGLRFKDGEPCPRCFLLFKAVNQDGAKEVLDRVKSLNTEAKP